MKDLPSVLEEFPKKRVVVIGDIILDHYIEGKSTKTSPEAPIPIILVEKEWFVPGGAGNTAVNIRSFGASACLAGRIGSDDLMITVINLLTDYGVRGWKIFYDSGSNTVEKNRILSEGKQIARFDKEKFDFLPESFSKDLISKLKSEIEYFDAILISDYAKGFITEQFAQELVWIAKEHQKILIADSKPKHFLWFKGCYCIKPNKVEAEEYSGIKIETPEDAEKAGLKIKKEVETNVLLTLGSMGMILFEDERTTHFTSNAKDVFDVTGAGDTVLAAFGLALASGASMRQATDLANHAAAIVIAKSGTASVTLEELKKSIS